MQKSTEALHGSTGRIKASVQSFLAQRQIEQFERNLVLLNDSLRASSLDGRYWVIGGLLLGWARERSILKHDTQDADFGLLRQDHDALLDAVSNLCKAGFEPVSRYLNSFGEAVEYRFKKDSAMFDFFVHDECNHGIGCNFFGTVTRYGRATPVEFTSRVDRYGLASMNFLGRTWLKPQDHEAYLAAVYGDWRTPDPDYDYRTGDLSVTEVRAWSGSSEWPEMLLRSECREAQRRRI